MIRKNILLLLLVFILAVLPGCWDYTDLDKLAIPIVWAFDTGNNVQGNQESGILEITGIFPSEEYIAGRRARIEVRNARLLGEALKTRGGFDPKTTAIGLLQAVLYEEALAKKGIHDISDALHRNPLVKTSILMAVVDGKAREVLEVPTESYVNQGIFLRNLLEKASQEAFLPVTTLHSFEVNTNNAGRNPVLPVVSVINEVDAAITGTGIFAKDKLIDIVGLKETQSLVMLRGIKCEGYIPFQVYKNGELLDKGTLNAKNSREVEVYRNGSGFKFVVKIKLKCKLFEHTSKSNLSKNTELIEEIEKSVKTEIESNCRQFIQKMQEEFKVDCIDITKYALAKWRKELEPIADNSFMEKADIVVDVNVVISGSGDIF